MNVHRFVYGDAKMNQDYSNMIKRLIQYREKLKLTQLQVSEMLEISQSNYSKVELQKVVLSGGGFSKLYACGWDIDYMMTGKESRLATPTLQQALGVPEQENYPLYALFCWCVRNRISTETLSESDQKELTILQLIVEQEKEDSALYYIRESMHLCQEEMAEQLVTSVKNYRDMEKGIRKPDGMMLFDLMRLTNCRPSLFIMGNGISWNIMNHLLGVFGQQEREAILDFLKSGLKME